MGFFKICEKSMKGTFLITVAYRLKVDLVGKNLVFRFLDKKEPGMGPKFGFSCNLFCMKLH